MALLVKQKIWFGTSFLFALIIITGSISIYQIILLRQDARDVLKDNYESLSYCHCIQGQLDSLLISRNKSISVIDQAIRSQEANVTEPREKEATRLLHTSFARLENGDTSAIIKQQLHQSLQTIIAVNMQAIQFKSERAEKTAEANLTLIIGAFCLVLLAAFTFSVNFPSIVTIPINHLLEAIKQISNKNYRHRVYLDNKDEFGNLADSFNQMAERLEYFESSNLNKLMFEKSRAEAVINSLKDASIGIDKNNTVLFANYQALQLLSLKSADIVGKTVEEATSRNDLFRYLISSESVAPFKILVENKENFFVREIVQIAHDEAKSKVIVLKNITSYKELDVAKTNFIATISHELKTPLSASDFSLKLLANEKTGVLSYEQKELIQNLKEDNKRMLKILSELLNMAQVESGSMQLHIQSVDPSVMVEVAMQTIAASAKEKAIDIKRIIASDLPSIQADAEKTTWVLNNFLTNAIKFSSQGAFIEIHVYKQDSGIIFSVKDRGIGIAKEYQPRLFDRYFQVPDSSVKGTGLGLAISKDFIEAQGGEIWVDSELGKGSVFYFKLPY